MIYKLILSIRHLFYDRGWKKSVEAEVPTFCIGNIAVGGTGKTPHVEYLLRFLLKTGWAYKNIAVLSRGYKRKSRGFQKVPIRDASARIYGDEPVQIAGKFPAVTVAVDKNRVRGCHILCHPEQAPKKCIDKDFPAADVIILDDAFQYRKIIPSLSTVLIDCNRPLHEDHLLPWGRLRDLPSRIGKADVVIVTKCPEWLDDWSRRVWKENLKLREDQKLFFTTIKYGAPQPVFPEGDSHYIYSQRLVLVTGIADDAPLRNYLSDTYKIVERLGFRDHHRFSRGDIHKISSAIREFPTACLMTTEKDAQRLRDIPPARVPEAIRKRLFYIPVDAAFLSAEEEAEYMSIILSKINGGYSETLF